VQVGDLVRHNICGIGIIIEAGATIATTPCTAGWRDCLVEYTSGISCWTDIRLLEVIQ